MIMCDIIWMPNGDEIESIREDGYCLCWSNQQDVITWIAAHIPNLEFDQELTIKRDCCGYEVSITENGVKVDDVTLASQSNTKE
jgi:hypothetical protein